jgi:hypothetical protein
MKLHGDTQEVLANYLEMSLPSVNQRIAGNVEFKAREIAKVKEKYNLTDEQVTAIFFN